MLTSNPLVQIPLSFLAITSAQGLSIWGMQEAVVIQWRFSVNKDSTAETVIAQQMYL